MKFFFTLFTILVFNLSFWAQSPVEIDVASLTISKEYLRLPFGSLTADGLPVPYQSPLMGWGGGTLGALEGCSPCLLGSSLETSFNQDNSFWGFNLGGEKRVRFYLTNTSPDIILSPAIRLKNRTFFRTVPAEIIGKIAIYDGNTLVAIDNEVNLTGTMRAEFYQFRVPNVNGDRRGFGFRNVIISYSQSPLQ